MKKQLIAISVAVCTVFTFASSAASPGTDDDPLVTKSYIDEVVYPYIDSKATGSATNNLEIVSIKAGQTLVGEAGTEIILRSGAATAVASSKGGLCDITAGIDLPDDIAIPTNHMLIVPVSDGRGAYAAGDCIFMVRGEYKVR